MYFFSPLFCSTRIIPDRAAAAIIETAIFRDDGDLWGQSLRQPTDMTNYGRSVLEQDPDSPGSLGVAISEAVEAAATSGGKKKYSLGSVQNHVLRHQSVIGEEALKQMDLAGEYPKVVIGCVGGVPNFAGLAYPFLRQNLLEGERTRLLTVEPTAAPTLTRGEYAFDYGDTPSSRCTHWVMTLFQPPSTREACTATCTLGDENFQ